MKKQWSIVILLLVFVLSACSQQTVNVTLTKETLGGESVDEWLAAEEMKAESVVDNEDGTVTFELKKEDQQQILKEMHENFKAMDLSEFASIETIGVNQEMTNVVVEVSSEENFINSLDSFVILGLGITTTMYQAFDGKTGNDISTKIQLKEQGGDVFNEMNFPQDLAE
ncbi:hypothetical protein IRY55_04940 [Savagea sp. SN6]|uniref:Uncharacterized protein n=1 Tax=Savagea serpentis TaxID=2785297 RepID=A0A8J7GIY4_9BACL|nr:hypothetical protein [Savagea serpentis]MBF4500705.1 hypothetical protein [Savagea serpentis]